MAEMLHVGILGAGSAAEGHAAAYSQLPDVEVTALWNRTRARAEARAGASGRQPDRGDGGFGSAAALREKGLVENVNSIRHLVTVHGVVFAIFVQALRFTAEQAMRRAAGSPSLPVRFPHLGLDLRHA